MKFFNPKIVPTVAIVFVAGVLIYKFFFKDTVIENAAGEAEVTSQFRMAS